MMHLREALGWSPHTKNAAPDMSATHKVYGAMIAKIRECNVSTRFDASLEAEINGYVSQLNIMKTRTCGLVEAGQLPCDVVRDFFNMHLNTMQAYAQLRNDALIMNGRANANCFMRKEDLKAFFETSGKVFEVYIK